METCKVSIILPVYNIVRWLDDCMESLVNQRYRNLEIWLSDDGSTDGSGELCDRWAKADARVRVIHKPNGGAASARNAALDQATGELVCFVDSDDVVDEEYVSRLVETLEQANADAAVCGFSFLKQSGIEPQPLITPVGVYDTCGFMRCFLTDWSSSLLWNKIFRREIIGNIRMDEGHRVDDEYFTYQVCMNAKTVTVFDQCLYHYRMRKSSVMQVEGVVNEGTMLDRIGYVMTRYAQIAERLPALEEPFFRDALDTLIRYHKHSKDMPNAQAHLRAWAKQHQRRWWRLPVSLKQKLMYSYLFFVSKPVFRGENNPIQLDQAEYFD